MQDLGVLSKLPPHKLNPHLLDAPTAPSLGSPFGLEAPFCSHHLSPGVQLPGLGRTKVWSRDRRLFNP